MVKAQIVKLVSIGYDVHVEQRLAAAEAYLLREEVGLVIVDVMMPTRDEEEEEAYPPEKTASGYYSGFMFAHRMRARLEALNAGVLFVSQLLRYKLDAGAGKFGVPLDLVFTKFELASNFEWFNDAVSRNFGSGVSFEDISFDDIEA